MPARQLGDFCFLPRPGDAAAAPAAAEEDSSITVEAESSWSYCGPLLTPSADRLPASFDAWARATTTGPLLSALLPVLALVNDFLTANRISHYWITLRATKQTHEFDRPRWHTDDLFFNDGSLHGLTECKQATRKEHKFLASPRRHMALQTDWKLCTTLLGPPTLFIPAKFQAQAREMQRRAKQSCSLDHVCTSIRCVGCASAADAVRQRLDRDLQPFGTVQTAPGEFAFLRLGPDGGAVHSEPCMSGGDRIFVNVIPGTQEELSTLLCGWGMEFPRSWWVATGILPALI